MLRSVCFKNFVNFEGEQMMDFSTGGPFIFIGENGSGKSSVLEGIRRCLKLTLSTSKSSVPDPAKISYFICHTEPVASMSNKNVIFGIVTIPLAIEHHEDAAVDDMEICNSEETMEFVHTSDNIKRRRSGPRKMSIDEEVPSQSFKRQKSSASEDIKSINMDEKLTKTSGNQKNGCRYFKFAMTCSEYNAMMIDLIDISTSPDGESNLNVSESYVVGDTQLSEERKRIIEHFVYNNSKHHDIEVSIRPIFKQVSTVSNSKAPTSVLDTLLCDLTKQFVFTFPLRSIGPLQWSESERITFGHREQNYIEAENRCEIIRYFLENKNLFDIDKERQCFQQLTQSADYNFELKEGKIHVSNGKFALLKTPEGILEAKAFSILISSKLYKSVILEEPDRGMHPQFVERMIHIIRQEQNNKRVILTTHQKGFISPWTVLDTFIFRRNEAKTYIISGKSIFDKDNVKEIRLLTSHHIPDILFTKKVLFYEGDSEELFLGELKRQILIGDYSITSKLFKGDEAASNRLKNCLMEYTFIKMNSKYNRKFYDRISRKLMLTQIFLVDKDAVQERIQTSNPANLKIFRSDHVERKHTFFWLDGNIEDMVFAMCKDDTKLESDLAKQKVIRGQKLFTGKNVESCHIAEAVKLLLSHCKPDDDLADFIKTL